MINKVILTVSSGILMLTSCMEKDTIKPLQYPETRTQDVVDNYFGTEVKDPYRWLEDDLATETTDWVNRQNELTQSFLNRITFRDVIFNRLEELWNYEKLGSPFQEGDYTYYFKNDGLQNHSVMYRTDKEGNTEVFLDPNTFSDDATTSLAGLEFSKSGKLLAYQISEGGSDWRKVIIMDAYGKQILEDTLMDVKFSGLSWLGDEGFYYSSYQKPTDGSQLSAMTDQHQLFYHKLGTQQSEDELIFGGNKLPRRYISGGVSEDGRYLVISAANTTTGNELYIKDLSIPNSVITPVISDFAHSHSVIHTEGEEIFILTNLNAPNKRLVKTSLNALAPENWTDIIPENDMPLSISTGAGKLFASYLKDAASYVVQFDLQGKQERVIELPGVGSASGFGGKWDEKDLYYSFTNYTYPSTIFKYDAESGNSELYNMPEIKFNPDDFESKQVFYASKDGTKIPMIITYKKGVALNGKNPTILYGYGGFNVSLPPRFSVANVVWMENGGVYAVANLRGGGEYGKRWHDGGRLYNKQNVFDDFIAAAEYLITNKYTSSDFLAISGGSNGGLLVGACMIQKPELFKVAVPAVGVLDMLRYHKFTAGAGWAYDYGTSEDSLEMFEYLYAYSPYHNLKKGQNYPATLVTTADHDDRVVPAHSFKFAAQLQAVNDGANPTLIRIETNAGHGAGKSTKMTLEEITDKYAFILYNMGLRKL